MILLSLLLMLSGSFTEHTYTSSHGTRQYWLYVPTQKPTKLLVMLHGCTQDGPDIARGTRLNEWAERERMMVVYPEQPAEVQAMKCWHWFDARHQMRGEGEPAIIAGITNVLMDQHGIDSSTVFLAGLSAGAAMAGLIAAAYPELYRAVALHSGPQFRAAASVSDALRVMKSGGPDPAQQALLAYQTMGERARPIPTIIFHGAQDAIVAPLNGAQTAEQWRHTNDHADDGVANGSLAVDTMQAENYTRVVVNTQDQRTLVEYWLIGSLGHAWSGGSPDGTYTDPGTLDASREMLRFFRDVR